MSKNMAGIMLMITLTDAEANEIIYHLGPTKARESDNQYFQMERDLVKKGVFREADNRLDYPDTYFIYLTDIGEQIRKELMKGK